MTRGSVIKLVNTHGSTWGRIQPDGDGRGVFFNADSLTRPADFATIEMGQVADFDERFDHVNGTRAIHMVLVTAESVGTGAPS